MQNEQININEYLSQCDPQDVLSFNNQKWVGIAKLKEIINRALRNSGVSSMVSYMANHSEFNNTESTATWFSRGEECEILRAGSKGWQKGKIKINVTLEFIPDEPEENVLPLNNVRQEIN